MSIFKKQKSRRLIWQIFIPYFIILLLSLGTAVWFISREIHDFHIDNLKREQLTQARIIKRQVKPLLRNQSWSEANELAKQISDYSGARITFITWEGTVIGESHMSAERMGTHWNRPEIVKAAENTIGHASRHSGSIDKEMLYTAITVEINGQPAGFIRLARPLTGIQASLSNIYQQVGLIGITAAVATALLGLATVKHIAAPLENIRKEAEKIAGGDLNPRPIPSNCRELDSVSETLKYMAGKIANMLQDEKREKAKLSAILSSMTEGVIAVSGENRIININQAAFRILELPEEERINTLFPAAIQHHGLQEIQRVTAARRDSVQEKEIIIYGRENRYLQVHATKLQDHNNDEQWGVLLVLHDISQIRKLENTRKEFVANVSHELRTPVTAIRGALETILDSPLEERKNTEERFLQPALRHTIRLEQLIQDLLILSRIEQFRGKSLELTENDLTDAIHRAVGTCRDRNPDQAARIKVECPPELRAKHNSSLLEQAIVNLIDNALNYSPAEKPVKVIGRKMNNKKVIVQVSDQGCGIEPAYKERIFERFYRIDKARSRKAGGTGLGLSIVKHIIQAHNGTVSVDSEPQKGSVFTITLPANDS